MNGIDLNSDRADGIGRVVRTVAAIDSEIYNLTLSLDAIRDVCAFDRMRIDSDMVGEDVDRRGDNQSESMADASTRKRVRANQAKNRHEHRIVREQLAELRAERRLWTDRTPLGMREIAAMLGYSEVAARQWKRRNVLPAPAGAVSGTPYWWRGDVLGWALQRGRTRMIVELEIEESEWDSDDMAAAL